MLKIYKDINQAQYVADVTDSMANYQRQTNGIQGDFSATTRLQRNGSILTDYFNHWLGYWLIEYLDGSPQAVAFAGQVYALRLFLNGRVYLNTLDDVVNDVVVIYNTSGGGPFVATATNALSTGQYGVQASIEQISIEIDNTTASNMANDFVADFAQPEGRLIGFYDRSQGNYLEIVTRGSGRILERELMVVIGASLLDDISTLIGQAVGFSQTIQVLSIATNINRQVETITDYTTIWSRLSALIKISGTDWRGQVIAGKFKYYQIDKAQPRYRLTFDDGKPQFWIDLDNRRVPDQLVEPGHYVRVPGVSGLPDTILMDNITLNGQTGLQFTPAFQDRLSLIRARLKGL